MAPRIPPSLPVWTFLQQRTRIFAVRPLHCQHLLREDITQARRRNDRGDVTAMSMTGAQAIAVDRLLDGFRPAGRGSRGVQAGWRSSLLTMAAAAVRSRLFA
ncbi:MAG TPA: hypothetical protein VFE77_15855 [Rhodanobacter sp.]|nr:hypothetical protein [Rhodanobacter sp.]